MLPEPDGPELVTSGWGAAHEPEPIPIEVGDILELADRFYVAMQVVTTDGVHMCELSWPFRDAACTKPFWPRWQYPLSRQQRRHSRRAVQRAQRFLRTWRAEHVSE